MVSATQQEVLVQPRRLAKSSNGVEDGAGSCGDALNSGLRARERSAIHWRGAFLARGSARPPGELTAAGRCCHVAKQCPRRARAPSFFGNRGPAAWR